MNLGNSINRTWFVDEFGVVVYFFCGHFCFMCEYVGVELVQGGLWVVVWCGCKFIVILYDIKYHFFVI